jgi:hypothetical protein
MMCRMGILPCSGRYISGRNVPDNGICMTGRSLVTGSFEAGSMLNRAGSNRSPDKYQAKRNVRGGIPVNQV